MPPLRSPAESSGINRQPPCRELDSGPCPLGKACDLPPVRIGTRDDAPRNPHTVLATQNAPFFLVIGSSRDFPIFCSGCGVHRLAENCLGRSSAAASDLCAVTGHLDAHGQAMVQGAGGAAAKDESKWSRCGLLAGMAVVESDREGDRLCQAAFWQTQIRLGPTRRDSSVARQRVIGYRQRL